MSAVETVLVLQLGLVPWIHATSESKKIDISRSNLIEVELHNAGPQPWDQWTVEAVPRTTGRGVGSTGRSGVTALHKIQELGRLLVGAFSQTVLI